MAAFENMWLLHVFRFSDSQQWSLLRLNDSSFKRLRNSLSNDTSPLAEVRSMFYYCGLRRVAIFFAITLHVPTICASSVCFFLNCAKLQFNCNLFQISDLQHTYVEWKRGIFGFWWNSNAGWCVCRPRPQTTIILESSLRGLTMIFFSFDFDFFSYLVLHLKQ